MGWPPSPATVAGTSSGISRQTEVVSYEVGVRSRGSLPSSSWPWMRRRSKPVMRVVTRTRPSTRRKLPAGRARARSRISVSFSESGCV